MDKQKQAEEVASLCSQRQAKAENDDSPPLAGGGRGEGESVGIASLRSQRQIDYTGLAARLAPLPVPAGVTFLSPSGLGGALVKTPVSDCDDTPEQEPAGLSAGLSAGHAVARGLLIHAALERYGRAGSYDLAELASRIPATQKLAKGEEAALVSGVEKTLARLLSDKEIAGLLSPGAGKQFELPLLLRRGGTIIGGSADLVVVEGDTAMVIDYKTGMADMSVAAVRAAYAPQLGAYRDAVREAFGLREVSAYLLLVDRVELVRVFPA